MIDQIISIGIPTRNRKNAIFENSKRTLESLTANVPYLISDNASEDGTEKVLAQLARKDPRLQLVAHSTNLGFAGNLLSLFERCATPYLLISSDEDFIVGSSLPGLASYLGEKQPMFVSSSVKSSYSPSHDRTGVSKKPISLKRIRNSSNYLSGLVFSVELYKQFRDIVAGLESNVFLKLYPQVALASLASLKRSAYFWAPATTSPAFSLPTEIHEEVTNGYGDLSSRIEQMFAFDQVLSAFENSGFSSTDVNKLRRNNAMLTYYRIRKAMMAAGESPSKDYFDSVALETSLKSHLLKRVRPISKK